MQEIEKNVLLDVAEWSQFSCRTVAGFGIFYTVVAIGTIHLAAIFAGRWFSVSATGWRARNIRIAVKGFRVFPLLLFLMLGAIVLFQHHRRELFTDSANLVETGCYMLDDYRYEMPLERLRGRYEQSYSKGWHDEVIFSAGKSYRELSVDIGNTRYLANIRNLAPVAVEAYLREIKTRQ
ncbi:hypothetical protein [Rhizobium sp. Leaf386]|uniref:hypothetical protein n=1 Tax=Rhizobium sp. Leaf386 TaxID=1736359 RepID=UPI000715020B|nr:hypothetical protein [Rhizobium sp. Leaf386]KQS96333.1 hypothetical protein ASG50_04530 [Rhizobium sp. Leaf386]